MSASLSWQVTAVYKVAAIWIAFFLFLIVEVTKNKWLKPQALGL